MRTRSLIVSLGLLVAAPLGCSAVVGFDGFVGVTSGDGGGADGASAIDGGGTVDASANSSDASSSDSSSGDAASGDAENGNDASNTGAAYASAVLGDGPLAYFHLDETSGTTVHDASGHGHDGTTFMNVGLGGPGAFNGSRSCAHFDGASYISIASSVSDAGTVFDFTQKTPFTLEAWVKIDKQAVKDMTEFTFFAKEVNLGSGNYLGIDFFSEPSLKLQREDEPTDETEVNTGSGLATIATWYYLVGTYDGSALTVYVDLAVQGTVASGTLVPAVNVPFLIGAEDTGGSSSLIGSMDEIAIYDSALSKSQITAHFHAAGR